MSRRVVVPFARHTKASLDEMLARVAPESRELAAALTCCRHEHDHSEGGCIAAPEAYAPRAVEQRFTARDELKLRLFTVGVIVGLLVLAVVAINDLQALSPIGSAAVAGR